MHINFLLHWEYFLQRTITPRKLAPSSYFLLCRYILLISMCLQKLMNIHHCVFKILGKNQRPRRTHGRTWKRYTCPQTKFAGGIKRTKKFKNLVYKIIYMMLGANCSQHSILVLTLFCKDKKKGKSKHAFIIRFLFIKNKIFLNLFTFVRFSGRGGGGGGGGEGRGGWGGRGLGKLPRPGIFTRGQAAQGAR